MKVKVEFYLFSLTKYTVKCFIFAGVNACGLTHILREEPFPTDSSIYSSELKRSHGNLPNHL